MNDLTTTATEEQFYTEHINRFFHPKSYFFYCLSKFLESPASISKTAEVSITQLLSQLFHYLIKSKQPVQELNEITQIKGFENIYSHLQSQLIRYDLRSLNQLQLKKAIQNIALYILKDIYHILENDEKGRTTLTTYLEIKMKLRDLLNGSNGKHNSKDLKNFSEQNINKKFDENTDRLLNPPPPPYPLDKTSSELHSKKNTIESVNFLNNFFEKEVARLLEPFTIFSNQTLEFYTNSDFIRQIQENFSQIKELAMYHGHKEVEAISERISQITLMVISMNHSINEQLIGLIYDAKAAIEKYIFHHQDLDNLQNLLDDLDHFISDLMNSVNTYENQANEQTSLSDPDEDEIGRFEINTSFNKFQGASFNSSQNKNPSPIFSGFHSETDSSENIDSIKIPGEDDEELLKLIQESDLSKEFSPPINETEHEQVEKTAPQITVPEEAITDEDHQDNEDNFNSFSNQIFQQESVLYFKILMTALSQLKNEEKIQSALEDIELASSSLKQLAQKFGMEKLAHLPELIESISILANKHIIKLPLPILQDIEDGVILLKEFDINNTEHKTKFMFILANLKEYYSKTLDTTEKISIAS